MKLLGLLFVDLGCVFGGPSTEQPSVDARPLFVLCNLSYITRSLTSGDGGLERQERRK